MTEVPAFVTQSYEAAGEARLQRELVFIVPRRLDQLTSGYLFYRHIVEGLRAHGRVVRAWSLRHGIRERTGRCSPPLSTACEVTPVLGTAHPAAPAGATCIKARSRSRSGGQSASSTRQAAPPQRSAPISDQPPIAHWRCSTRAGGAHLVHAGAARRLGICQAHFGRSERPAVLQLLLSAAPERRPTGARGDTHGGATAGIGRV